MLLFYWKEIFIKQKFKSIVKKITCFNAKKGKFYTHQLKSANSLIEVIKGVDSAVQINKIKSV